MTTKSVSNINIQYYSHKTKNTEIIKINNFSTK
jgi:hypothetical protein